MEGLEVVGLFFSCRIEKFKVFNLEKRQILVVSY